MNYINNIHKKSTHKKSTHKKSTHKKSTHKKIYNCIVKLIITKVEFSNTIPYTIVKQSKSVGSGFFIDLNSNILTAAHVIKNMIDIWIRIPKYGKKIFKGEILCVYPDFDLAIIKIVNFKNPDYLTLGNSETLILGQHVYAFGYPDNAEYPMITSGTINGRRDDYIQFDAAINGGHSGGPLLDSNNKVVGVNSAVLAGSEDSSLTIPIKSFLTVKKWMLEGKHNIIHKNALGIILVNGNNNYRRLHSIKKSCIEGQILKKILKESPLKSFAKEGDILCTINDYKIDYYGEISVSWEDGKVPFDYIVKRSPPLGEIKVQIYSIKLNKTITKKIRLKSFSSIYPIRQLFTHIEKIDYEVFAGLVVMNLNLDHIFKSFPHLSYLVFHKKIYNPVIVITHIFENSDISKYILPLLIVPKMNTYLSKKRKMQSAFLWRETAGLTRVFFVSTTKK